MGCGGGGGTQTSTTVNSVPDWVSNAGQDIFHKAQTFYNSGYQPYTGQRQAPLNADQNSAFDQVRSYHPPAVTGEAMDMVRRATQPLSTERTVDQNGRLGSFDDYLNPYRMEALNPAIDAINRSSDAQRKQIGGNAMSAHAFGDARHGIMDARLNQDTSRAIGDTVSTALGSQFNTMMGQRAGDLDRFNHSDLANRAALMGGASALPQIASADQNSFLARMQALMGAGGVEQQQAQTALDIPYQQYQAQQQDAYDRLASLVSVIGGVPYTRTQTTTSPKPADNGLWGALGSVLGSAAGAFI
jgi:hypothetical protein